MNNLDNVQKGDIVVCVNRTSKQLLTVTHTTKTQIHCNGNKFNRNTGDLIRPKDKYNWLDNTHIYLPTPKQLQELREDIYRQKLIRDIGTVDLTHQPTDTLTTVYDLFCNRVSGDKQRIDELETKVTELEEQNYEYQDKIRDLEYELEERNSYHSYLIKQLIQLARNNVTPYSQQDNDIWGIQQEIEKILNVSLAD